MGCAPIAHVLYSKIMRYDPKAPKWVGRDRFVLSNGHASALLYSMLHLTGYDLPMEQLQVSGQWGGLWGVGCLGHSTSTKALTHTHTTTHPLSLPSYHTHAPLPMRAPPPPAEVPPAALHHSWPP